MDSAPIRPASSRSSWSAILAGLLVALATIALVALGTPLIAGLAVAGLGVFIYLACGNVYEKSVLLTVVAACLLPHETFRRIIKPEEVMPLVALLFLALRPRTSAQPSAMPRLSATELWVFLLIAAALQGAIHGIMVGYPFDHVADEFGLYLQFAVAIVVIRGKLSERGIRHMIWGLVIATLLVSVQYLNMFAAHGGLGRAVSDQQHLLNIAIPLLFAFALLARNTRERIGALALVLPMILATYVTQTRAIWLYVPFSVALLAVLYVVHRHLRSRDLVLAGALSATAILVIAGYILLTKGASAGHQAIAARAGTLKELSVDLSLAVRIESGFQALKRALSAPLFGCGLGDHFRPNLVYLKSESYLLDFSYMQVFWKLGVLGLAPLIALYAVFMKRVWFVYRRTDDLFQRRVAIGVFVSFVALLMIGFESGILINFRFNLVWAVLMGVFELWKQRIEKRLPAGRDTQVGAH